MDQVLEPDLAVDADVFWSAMAWDGGPTRMMIKPEAVRELTGDGAGRTLGDSDAVRVIEHP